MMNILIPITTEDESWHALGSATLLARRMAGHLDALYVLGDTAPAVNRYDSAPEGIHRQAMAALKKGWAEQTDGAKRRFEGLIRQQDVLMFNGTEGAGAPTASWQVFEGTEADAVQRWGGVHDVIVFGRIAGQDGAWRENIEKALFGSGRPVLLVPSRELGTFGEHVVVGWNRSPQSARALADAVPLLRQAERVTVLSVTTGIKPGPTPQDAAQWLSRHGVAAQVLEVPPSQNGVGNLLLSEAHELEADLLVIGAYSHSRIRQAIFGGTTRHILVHADLPVFMAH
jgi:nucleotide-binding universal stress UspA family protein